MSSPHLDTKSAKGEKFLKRAEREACWCARDSFWECMRANDEDGTKCQAQRRKFEEMCPRTWVSHFDRKVSTSEVGVESVLLMSNFFAVRIPQV